MDKITKNGIKASTIIRCVIFIVVLINQVLAIFGKGLPFNESLAYQIFSVALTVIVGAWTAWKNNDFTKLAVTAGNVFDALKDGKITQQEANELIDKADKIIEDTKNIEK